MKGKEEEIAKLKIAQSIIVTEGKLRGFKRFYKKEIAGQLLGWNNPITDETFSSIDEISKRFSYPNNPCKIIPDR